MKSTYTEGLLPTRETLGINEQEYCHKDSKLYTINKDGARVAINGDTFKGMWFQKRWLENDVVFNSGFLAFAKRETTDYPTPTNVGVPEWADVDVDGLQSINAKQVLFGTRYNFPRAFTFSMFSVYTVIDTQYDLYLVTNPTTDRVIKPIGSFIATSAGWTEASVTKQIIYAGTETDIIVVANQPDAAPVTVTANYDYDTPNNTSNPTQGQIVQANKDLPHLRVHQIDDDGTDRSALLANLSAGDIIEHRSMRWTVQSTSDEGTWYEISVNPASQSTPDGVDPFNFETVASVDIEYGIKVDGLAGVENMQGLYIADGSYDDVAVNDNQYGISIKLQDLQQSDDWNVVPVENSSTGGDSIMMTYTGNVTAGQDGNEKTFHIENGLIMDVT